MNRPTKDTDREAIYGLMQEVMALNQRVPNCPKRIYDAFMTIYFNLDRQLEKV